MLLLSVLSLHAALAGRPIIAPGVNSSRVTPGGKVKSMEMATKLAGVKTVTIGTISGPYGKRFTDSLYLSLRKTKQGQYKTGADVGASAVGGLGQLAAVASGSALSSTGVPGAGLVGNLSEKVVGDTTDKVADNITNNVTDHITNYLTNNITIYITNIVADNITNNVTNHITNDLTNNITIYINHRNKRCR